jgi:hypothetical protein
VASFSVDIGGVHQLAERVAQQSRRLVDLADLVRAPFIGDGPIDEALAAVTAIAAAQLNSAASAVQSQAHAAAAAAMAYQRADDVLSRQRQVIDPAAGTP